MSNNLDITQVEENQASKEVTINDGFAAFDAALTEYLVKSVAAGNVVLTDDEYIRHIVFVIDDDAVASRSFTLPAIKRMVCVRNTSAETVAIVCGSTSIDLDPDTAALALTDGTTNGLTLFPLPAATGAAKPFKFSLFWAGLMDDSEILWRFVADAAIEFAADLADWTFDAGTASTSTTTLDVKVNGVSVGSIEFASSATGVGDTSATPIALAIGDVLEIVAPGTADTTLSDVAVSGNGELT